MAYVAFLLGHRPETKIIVASYGLDLALDSALLQVSDLGRGIFGDAGQEISALRQVRRLKA